MQTKEQPSPVSPPLSRGVETKTLLSSHFDKELPHQTLNRLAYGRTLPPSSGSELALREPVPAAAAAGSFYLPTQGLAHDHAQ